MIEFPDVILGDEELESGGDGPLRLCGRNLGSIDPILMKP